jgi:hypothetical protein
MMGALWEAFRQVMNSFGGYNGTDDATSGFSFAYAFSRRSMQYKKNKTWDGDGVLARNGFACKLFDHDGKP